ncbi:hypothetical protein DFAR_3800064 [Desulfarculales bacterium]
MLSLNNPTSGLRPNLDDYLPEQLGLISRAQTIYYHPTDAFAEMFHSSVLSKAGVAAKNDFIKTGTYL